LASAPSARARFEAEAARYDAAYEASGAPGRALRDRMATVLDLVGDSPGEVLDAGMGPGRLLEALDRRGWRVSGVDASEAMVALAEARLPQAGGRLVRGAIEDLPFGDASFDLVVATGVLEYADDLRSAVAEISRTLRPGGRAIVSLPNWWSASALCRRKLVYPVARAVPGRGGQAPPPPRRVFRTSELERLLAEAGLSTSALLPTSFRPRALRRLGLRTLAAQFVFAAERLAP
jgi:SAM-dependent methyltransferase